MSLSNPRQKKQWPERFNCPYMLCPSNQPFRNAKRPKMKFVQNINFSTAQYKCKDCGCLTNLSIDTDIGGLNLIKQFPGLDGGRFR